jgi:two-component system response regulator AtoC
MVTSDEATRVRRPDEDTPAKLQLVVIGTDEYRTYAVEPPGPITIGRSDRSMVVLGDELASREHARVHVVPELAVEDLESANGTLVGGKPIAPRVRVGLTLGQAIQVGSTVMLVVPSAFPRPSARLESIASLEGRLHSLCSGAERGTKFSVLRVVIEAGITAEAAQRAVTAGLGPRDVCAAYAPGELVVLLATADGPAADQAALALASRLETLGGRPRMGVASYPDDALTADGLLEEASPRGDEPGEPVFVAPEMRALLRMVQKLARGNIGVLLLGETGVGKEVIAEELHRRSLRAAGPFVRINCAAIPDSLAESELFGHVRGAYSGAQADRAGLLEAAHGGTVFLDEVGELPLAQQAMLLRAVERREVVRVGSSKPIPIDVRFVSATNRDLNQEVAERRFRQDLLFRLAGATLHIPPLRGRVADVVPLAERFLRSLGAELGRPNLRLSAEAVTMMQAYGWPGNVRELRNAIERALLLASGPEVLPQHLPIEKMEAAWAPREATTAAASPSVAPPDDLTTAERAERRRMIEALEACDRNQSRAAIMLGVPRRTFTHRMKRFGLQRGKDWVLPTT